MQAKGIFYVSMLLLAGRVNGEGTPATVALPEDPLDIVQRDSNSHSDARVRAEHGANQEAASPAGVALKHDEAKGLVKVHVLGEHLTTMES